MRVNDKRLEEELAKVNAELEELEHAAPTSPVDAALGFFDALLGVAKAAPAPRTSSAFGAGPASGSRKKSPCGACIGRRK